MDNSTHIHSKEAEKTVLSCMLTSIESLDKGCNLLSSGDFYFLEHQTIFQAIKSAKDTHKVSDIQLTYEELKKQGKSEVAGGLEYLAEITGHFALTAYIDDHIDILKDYSNKRKLIALSSELKENVLGNKDLQKIILSTQESLKQIEKNGLSKDKFSIKSLDRFDLNFLLDEPARKPSILEYYDYTNQSRKPFLPKSIVAMLAGPGGVGKSHLLAQLSVAIASGTPFLGEFETTPNCGQGKKGNVFFGLGENDYEDIHRLLYKATKTIRKDSPEILEEAAKRLFPFSFHGQRAAFLDDKKPSNYFRELKLRLQDLPPFSLIILDPISRLMGADAETDNAAATDFIALLEELTMDLPGNPTIVFSHHVNKGALNSEKGTDQSAARGSSAITDGVRLQWNLFNKKTEGKQQVCLTTTKSNFTATHKEITLEKENDGYLINANTQQSKERIDY